MDLPIDLSGLINHRDGFQRWVLWEVKGSANWPFSPPFWAPRSEIFFKKRGTLLLPRQDFLARTRNVSGQIGLQFVCVCAPAAESSEHKKSFSTTEERAFNPRFLIENQKSNDPRAQTKCCEKWEQPVQANSKCVLTVCLPFSHLCLLLSEGDARLL